MRRLNILSHKSFSIRLSLWIVAFVALLFVANVVIMFYFAHQAIKEEALARAEKTVDAAILSIDNLLSSTETAVNNVHWSVEHHTNQPDALAAYCQEFLQSNPTIEGCAIAFLDGREMVYYYRKNKQIVKGDHFGTDPLAQQEWVERPVKEGHAVWTDPLVDETVYPHPIISYSVPLREKGRIIGVIAADISLVWLSNKIEHNMILPNSSFALMSKNGSFIIHPDSTMLKPGSVDRTLKETPNEQLKQLAQSMIAGESGYIYADFYGYPSYIFYKPYKNTKWSIDYVYYEGQIFAGYYYLQFLMMLIGIVGLIVLFFCCFLLIERIIRPLRELDGAVQQLTAGNYDEPIPTSHRSDEIGHLQRAFHSMQLSLSNYLHEIKQQQLVLSEHNKALQVAHDHAQEANRIKSTFLQNMTDQMVKPSETISCIVETIQQKHQQLNKDDITQMTKKLDDNSKAITSMLTRILEISEKKKEE
ncbi:methyl-accepting chemotaxis protein [Prevotella sp. tf2-5]|uniref:PDC sensor domain-containing protein n=1 Tax=Prevotella sp. tf2-5 TaxID=1761889 RepID=UPI0008EDA23F|nr:methyl-accepting chemotaxis protein [Prevotella sp. tf2-5]SFO43834.1 methyl-accepting chemotaxis protein [Prevotella sp. tf2-5]